MSNKKLITCPGGRRRIRRLVWSTAGLVLLIGCISVASDAAMEGSSKVVVQSGAQKEHAHGADAHEQDPNKVVMARVNGTDITMQSVVVMMNRIMAKKGHGNAAEEDFEEIRQYALHRLIFQELALQEAKAHGLKADREKVDDAIANLKVSMGGEGGYEEYLKQEKMTPEELRAQVERSITLEMISNKKMKEFNDRFVLTEDDLKKEYEKEKSKFMSPEKVSVTDVVLFLPIEDNASKRKAEAILEKIRQAKDHDPMNLTEDGTFIVREINLDEGKQKELYDAAKKLKVGELSGVVETSDSLHIIKLKEYKPKEQYTFDQVKAFIERKLRGQALKKMMEDWEAELKKNATIEIMDIKKQR